MRNFTTEDFSGAGQYLVRVGVNPKQISEALSLSTVMYKVGYLINNHDIGTGENFTCLISMADGWTKICHYENTKDENGKSTPPETWEKVLWQGEEMGDGLGKQKFVDYLNNPKLSQEMRFATQEEVVRVVMAQRSRWR